MVKQISSLASVLVLALLAGCGGSDDQDLTRYIGTWATCTPGTGTATEKETITLGPQSGNTLQLLSSTSIYLGPNCTGTSTILPPVAGTVAFNGTKTIGAEVVDKVVVTHEGTSNKDVLVVRSVSALTLLTGLGPDQGGAVDAEGYPVALDNNTVFARQ